jgi:Icc-related predicted phosphoesterase
MIADTHGFHRDPFFDDMPDGDLLIHAGDLSMMGELDVLHDVNDWFWELSKTKYNDIIVIGGNHDKSLGGKDMLAYKIFTGAHYLEESSITINDKLIYGSPQTPWNYEYIANMFAWGSLKNSITWRGIPRKTDILITHTPPYGFGDLLAEHSSDPNTHIGDKRLLDKIMEYKPELNICGHIHEGYGVREEEDTTFINCSVVDEHYNLKNEPVVINI